MSLIAETHNSETPAGPRAVAARPSAYLPAVEGMRAVAAIGVLFTHTAFQTDSLTIPVVGPLLGRLDLAVAVFFAISGFLLWRVHAAAARGPVQPPPIRRYLRHRAVRILPAYWVAVIVVLGLIAGGSAQVWFANLALLQLYVPFTLTTGLTQMWSLAVEVAFYIALPFIAMALKHLQGNLAIWRAPVILAASVMSLGWAHFGVPIPLGAEASAMPPAYLSWFGAGMLLAELVAGSPDWINRLARRRWVFYSIAGAAFCVSATAVAGPVGLAVLESHEFSTKTALGAIVAFCLMTPVVAGGHRNRWLQGRVMLTLGRWSYGIFIWHVAMLAVALPVMGVLPFSGHFVAVSALTLALTIPIAASSYALVEEPLRLAARRWEKNHPAPTAEAPVKTSASKAGN